MKSLRVLLVFALCLIALGSMPGSVMAAKFPAYASSVQIQNLSSTSRAMVTLTFYNGGTGADAGTVRETITVKGSDLLDGIPASASVTYATLPFSDPASFNGSLVISSDQEIAAISNIAASSGTARASYIGATTGSTSVNLPLLQKNNGSRQWSSWYTVQNVGDTSTTVTADYTDCVGTSDATATIPPSASVTFDQVGEACHTSALFGVTLTSSGSQPILAVVIQESSIANALLAYTGFSTSGNADLKIPLVNSNNNGWNTGIQILNKGADTTLTLTYADATLATTCTETQSIASGVTKVFASAAFASGGVGITTTCQGKKIVGAAYLASPSDNSAGSNLLAVVNQTKATTSYLGGSYTSFASINGTPKVVFPLVMDRRGSTQWRTGFNIMNVGSATTWVKCTFSGSAYTKTQQIDVNKSMNANQQNAIAANYIGAATCQAYTDATYTTLSTTAQIVGVANESGTGSGDLLLTYEGINTTN